MKKYLLISLLLANLSYSTLIAQSKSDQPNILLFLIDDIRNTSLGCYGHPIIQSPNIDEIAQNGTRFENAFVTTSICAASRASILTGLYESTHQYTFGKPPIIKAQTNESFPLQLKNSGYQTGFIGKWGMKTEVKPETLYDYYQPIGHNPFLHKQADGSLRHEAELCGDGAIDFINNQKDEGPFCLQVSFNSVHAADNDKENHYPIPKSVAGKYADMDMPLPRLNDPKIYESMPIFLKESLNRVRYFWRWDTPEKYQKNMRNYFRMITGVDTVIGRVMNALEENGLDQNTIIIIMGDNGYYMGDRGFAGKWSHFEESLRVPLIIFDPRQPEGHINEQLVLNIDLAATILDYAQVNIPANYQGESLKTLVENRKAKKWRTSFFVEHRMNHKQIPKWEGVRQKRFVYANYYEQQPAYEFLYDLEKDPDQLVNLVNEKKYRNVLKKMRKKVRRNAIGIIK